MEVVITRINSDMINEIQELADLTVGRGLVSSEEIAAAANGELSFVLQNSTDDKIIGFSLSEIIEPKVLVSIYNACIKRFSEHDIPIEYDEKIANLGALGIAPQYQRRGYGRILFQTITDGIKQKFNCISALAWKKGMDIPMKTLLEQAGFDYFGLLRSPYKDVSGIYCDYCKGDVCVCDSCLYIWQKSK